MLGFRAMFNVFEKFFFHAAAAALVGVLGVSSFSDSLDSCGEAKGSEERNWKFDFVVVTREARRLVFRGGGM